MATTEELVNGFIDIACLNGTKFSTPEMCFGVVLWDDPPTDQLVSEVGILQASMIIAGYLMIFMQKKINTGEWDCDQEAAYDKFISEELAYLRQAQWHYDDETQSLYEEVARTFQGPKWARLQDALQKRTLADNENTEDPYNILDRVAYTLYLKEHDKQSVFQFKIQTLNAFAWLCHAYPMRLGLNDMFIESFFITSFRTGLSMNLPPP